MKEKGMKVHSKSPLVTASSETTIVTHGSNHIKNAWKILDWVADRLGITPQILREKFDIEIEQTLDDWEEFCEYSLCEDFKRYARYFIKYSKEFAQLQEDLPGVAAAVLDPKSAKDTDAIFQDIKAFLEEIPLKDRQAKFCSWFSVEAIAEADDDGYSDSLPSTRTNIYLLDKSTEEKFYLPALHDTSVYHT